MLYLYAIQRVQLSPKVHEEVKLRDGKQHVDITWELGAERQVSGDKVGFNKQDLGRLAKQTRPHQRKPAQTRPNQPNQTDFHPGPNTNQASRQRNHHPPFCGQTARASTPSAPPTPSPKRFCLEAAGQRGGAEPQGGPARGRGGALAAGGGGGGGRAADAEADAARRFVVCVFSLLFEMKKT